MNIIMTCVAAIFILLIPGFIWSFVFYRKASIDTIERLSLSLILSIAIVPLIVFYTNLIGVKINILALVIQIVIVILFALAIILFREIKK